MRRALRFPRLSIVIVFVSALVAGPAGAQTPIPTEPPIACDWRCPIIVPWGEVVVESYDVDVTIENQIAVTRTTQVFRNDGPGIAEGTFLFPLPRHATVSDLLLWIDNEPVRADLLPADEARAVYEEIVRTLRDPALLEWIDRDLVRLAVFPIEHGASRKVEVEYAEVLPADHNLVRFTHPLGKEHVPTVPWTDPWFDGPAPRHHAGLIENLSLRIEIESGPELQTVYSPGHAMDVDRVDEHRAVATFEAELVSPGEEFSLFYSYSETAIGVDLVTFSDDDDDGFFLLFVSPALVDDAATVPKDVIIVLDRSGSMEGEKFEQAQTAARYVLNHLNDDDRFGVVTFSSSVRRFDAELRRADQADSAGDWIDGQVAEGSTDINRALLEAFDLADRERPTYVIFLTDGLPTEGVTSADRILANATGAAPSSISLFGFGVGFDVDAYLIDSLAEELHGTADFVLPGEAIDETVSAFYAKVSSPVLTSVELDIDGGRVFDLHPARLPDLFAGEQLIVAGRYREPGPARATVAGRLSGEDASYEFTGLEFTGGGGDEFVPRLWATRKIGDLMREMRLEGASDEIVEQIVQLSTRYGIVTPYTSFLVTEPGLLGAEELQSWTRSLADDFDAALDVTSGEGAVHYSNSAGDLAGAPAATTTVPTGLASGGGPLVGLRTAGDRTYRLVDGIWVDTGFDPETMTPLAVPFLSADYFDLAAARPAIADALALGERVILLVDGDAIQVVAADEPGDQVTIPDPVATDPVDPDPATTDPVDPDPVTADPADPNPDPESGPTDIGPVFPNPGRSAAGSGAGSDTAPPWAVLAGIAAAAVALIGLAFVTRRRTET